jgi:hypothetical protein
MDHPYVSNYHMAPGSFGNPNKEENFEYNEAKNLFGMEPS